MLFYGNCHSFPFDFTHFCFLNVCLLLTSLSIPALSPFNHFCVLPFFLNPLLAFSLFILDLHFLSNFHLTPPLLLHAPLTFLLTPLGFLHLLVLTALVEVLHHHANKHVEDKKANDEKEGDEIQQHPRVVVGYRLGLEMWKYYVVMGKETKRELLRLKKNKRLFPQKIIKAYIQVPAGPHPQRPNRGT